MRTHAAADVRELSKLDMARALNLISESEYGGYRAKNFAVLMFADRPADFIPYAYVQVIREAIGTDKMEGKIFDGPIWIQAQLVIRYFEDNFHASYNIRDPRSNATHVVDNWPPIMFAELATNCILHKEYAKHNCVEISIYKDHISFINHNRPLPPVTIEDLNTKMEFKDRISDIDKEVFDGYLRKARQVGRISLDSDDPKYVMTKLELADGDTLLNAGAALFVNGGMNELQMARFASDERLTFNDIKRYTGSILDLADKAIVYVADAMDWRVEFDGSLERKEFPEIPVDAVR